LTKHATGPAGPKKSRILLVTALLVTVVAFLAGHELSTRFFQDQTCGVCHEMKEPLRKWRESGTAKNHSDCAGCHFDKGLAGWWELNRSAVKFLFTHFRRDPNEPIRALEEPLFLEEGREPGYWTRVPNHRCFQCHDAKNHAQADQEQIHEKALKDVLSKPCIDCHNHEMRKGQLFYQKVLPGQETTTLAPERRDDHAGRSVTVPLSSFTPTTQAPKRHDGSATVSGAPAAGPSSRPRPVTAGPVSRPQPGTAVGDASEAARTLESPASLASRSRVSWRAGLSLTPGSHSFPALPAPAGDSR